MKKLSAIVLSGAVALIVAACANTHDANFIHVENGRFAGADGKPLYFIGTNLWYGAFLAAEGPSGDRERLCRELDALKEAGIDNLRIAVGADGNEADSVKVKPILQTAPGEYNDACLDGLDFLMAEIGRRGMHAVLYLTNAWTWSGGYAQYLEWSGCGRYPIAEVDGWESYCDYVCMFHKADGTSAHKQLLDNHIRNIVTRTNRYTGKAYRDDPAIFSWQLCNEPRPFSDEGKEPFFEWVCHTAKLIKQLDPNHMVSTGSEGEIGCHRDLELWERIHAIPEIDYANIHIWPYNWRWVERATLETDVERACSISDEYIRIHAEIARKSGKPLVIEEFGYPRDGYSFSLGSTVTARDTYYGHILGQVLRSAAEGDILAGCNFWSWGGSARPQHLFWQRGDDYCGDPAQEEQGLYSVFDCDSTTVQTIRDCALRLK